MEVAGNTIRFPGGEISITKNIEEVYLRLKMKGFNEEVAAQMLLALFDTAPAESAIAQNEAVQSFLELLRGKVGEEDRSEIKLRVG